MFSLKTKRIAVIVAGVAVLIWLGFSYRTQTLEPTGNGLDVVRESDNSQGKSETHDPQTVQKAASNAPASSFSEDLYSKNIKLEKQFHSVRTGEEAQNIIERLYTDGFVKTAHEMEGRLAALCFAPLRFGPKNHDWLKDEVQKYCGSVEFSDDKFADIMAQFTTTLDQETAELNNQFKGLSQTERSELLRDKISNATSWRELELLKLIIGATPGPGEREDWVYELGQDSAFRGGSGRDVQVAALQLYQCELLGSYCGSSSMATINQCYISGLCQPGWTMRDFYDNTLSQLELEQVNLVLRYLRSIGG